MTCPSDCLELVIRDAFKGQKYFYSSLGNVLFLNDSSLRSISTLIEKEKIAEITFVLSEDNRIILDALRNQKFIEISGLSESYNHLMRHKSKVINNWVIHDQHTLILSCYLNEKIRELKSQLHQHLHHLPEVNAKLFSKPYSSFRHIYSELVCTDRNTLN